MSSREKRVMVSPDVMGGKPVVRGTRVTVARILDLLAQGMTPDEVLKEFPQLTPADVKACLAYGAGLANHEEVIPLPGKRPA